MTSRLIRNILFGLLVAGYLYYGIQYIQKSAVSFKVIPITSFSMMP